MGSKKGASFRDLRRRGFAISVLKADASAARDKRRANGFPVRILERRSRSKTS